MEVFHGGGVHDQSINDRLTSKGLLEDEINYYASHF